MEVAERKILILYTYGSGPYRGLPLLADGQERLIGRVSLQEQDSTGDHSCVTLKGLSGERT